MTSKSTTSELTFPAALIRLYWFFIRNGILFFLAIVIVYQKLATVFIKGVLCWSLYVYGGAFGYEACAKVLGHTV